MKKNVILILLILTLLLVVTKTAFAATTFYFGRSFGGQLTTGNASGQIIIDTIGFSYVEGLKLCVESESGPDNELGEIKFGFPIAENREGLIYITAGLLHYRPINSEANGGMLGFDFVSIITDRVYFEWDLQYSLLQASYRDIYTDKGYPLGWTSVKLKIQWILSDHLALAFNYHYMNLNINYSEYFLDASHPSLCLIYRI
jgi:hypothetical protein